MLWNLRAHYRDHRGPSLVLTVPQIAVTFCLTLFISIHRVSRCRCNRRWDSYGTWRVYKWNDSQTRIIGPTGGTIVVRYMKYSRIGGEKYVNTLTLYCKAHYGLVRETSSNLQCFMLTTGRYLDLAMAFTFQILHNSSFICYLTNRRYVTQLWRGVIRKLFLLTIENMDVSSKHRFVG
jgi:hypothetical protein